MTANALRLITVLAAVSLATASLHAQSSDGAVLHALKQSDRSLVATRIWHRVPLENRHDLVLAVGATEPGYLYPETGLWMLWPIQKLGLFLQDRTQPGRVFALTVSQGPPDCAARVLRATITDTVIGCLGEKSEIYPNQKFVYDVRAKRLVSRVEYAPFANFTIRRATADRVRLTASSDTQQVTLDFFANTSEFRIVEVSRLSATDSSRDRFLPPFPSSSRAFGPARAFKLAEGDYDLECGTSHVVVLETGSRRERHHTIPPSDCDRIGPWVIDGDRLWFGRSFYSGEGNTGTGGFGYFDAVSRRFHLFSPAEIRPFSATAILVQPDAVWLALAVHGEYVSHGEGIARYDRGTNALTRLNIGSSLGHRFVAVGDQILLALDNGLIVIGDGTVKGYIVDKTSDGRLRVAQAFK
jgi:hypothetical protein